MLKTIVRKCVWMAAAVALATGCADVPAGGAVGTGHQSVASATSYDLRELNFAPREYTSVFGINNRGTMVGNYAAVDDPTWAHVWGFVYERGTWTRVAIGDSPWVTVMAVNDHGVAVGEVLNRELGRFQAFRRDASGRIEILPTPTTFQYEAAATDINNAGTIVGNYYDEDAGVGRGYVYERGTVTPFSVPGAPVTFLGGIDDRGRLAGRYYDPSVSRLRGFVSDRGRLTTFDLPGAVSLSVDDINNRGQVVGSYTTLVDGVYARHGFVYEDGRVTTIDYAGSQYGDTRVIAINDSGTLVGTYDYGSWGLVGEPIRGR